MVLMEKNKVESSLKSELVQILNDTPFLIAFWGVYAFGYNVIFGLLLFLVSDFPDLMRGLWFIGWIVVAIVNWIAAKNYDGKKIWIIVAGIIIFIQGLGISLGALDVLFGITIIDPAYWQPTNVIK